MVEKEEEESVHVCQQSFTFTVCQSCARKKGGGVGVSAASHREKRPMWPNAALGFQTDRDSRSHYKRQVRPPPIWKINNAGGGRRRRRKKEGEKKSQGVAATVTKCTQPFMNKQLERFINSG